MGAEYILSSCLSLLFPDIVWREDRLIPTPQLIFPDPDRNFCLDVINSDDSQICLSWEIVPDATAYLIQWGLNPALNGPSVREQIVYAPTTFYCLRVPQDIRQGSDVYWRIQAANLDEGGVSERSETRKIGYSCGQDQNSEMADRCDRYNIDIQVGGPDSMGCCDYANFFVEVPFDCKDFNGNEVISVDTDNIVWSAKLDADDKGIIEPDYSNKFVTGIRTCSNQTQVMQVCAEIPFFDIVNDDTFSCTGCKNVFVDCGDPAESNCTVVKIPQEYHDTGNVFIKEIGEKIEQDCGCGGSCVFTPDFAAGDDTAIPTFMSAVQTYFKYNEPCGLDFSVRLTFAAGSVSTTYTITEVGDSNPVIYKDDENGNLLERTFFPLPVDYVGEEEVINLRYNSPCFDQDENNKIGFLITDDNTPNEQWHVQYNANCDEEKCNITKYHFSGPVYQIIQSDEREWPACDVEGDLCDCVFGAFKVGDCVLKVGETVRITPNCCEDCP